jgi:hypothetical protein
MDCSTHVGKLLKRKLEPGRYPMTLSYRILGLSSSRDKLYVRAVDVDGRFFTDTIIVAATEVEEEGGELVWRG